MRAREASLRALEDLAARVELAPEAVRHRLEQFSVEEIDRVLDGLEEGFGASGRRLLALLVRDDRLHVRIRTAELLAGLAGLEPEEVVRLVELLAGDSRPAVREVAAVALGRQLGRLGPVEAARVVCELSVSADWTSRAAVARAIGVAGMVLGSRSAVERLARDRFAEVRCGAAQAAAALCRDGDGAARRVLERLASDNRRVVRMAALAGLAKAPAGGLDPESVAPLVEGTLSADDETAEAAASALAERSSTMPGPCLSAYELIVSRMELVQPRALQRIIAPIASLASIEPRRSRRLLRRLQDHSEPWLSDEAGRAAASWVDGPGLRSTRRGRSRRPAAAASFS